MTKKCSKMLQIWNSSIKRRRRESQIQLLIKREVRILRKRGKSHQEVGSRRGRSRGI